MAGCLGVGMNPSVENLLHYCRQHGINLRTAESCTAGAIAAEIASVSGASSVLDRGWVTYSNEAKIEVLGVPKAYLENDGAVSQSVVEAMAEGGCDVSNLCIAVSGIAGPSGGSAQKPVGTVWLATAMTGFPTQSHVCHFSGNRHAVQRQTVEQAVKDMLAYARQCCGGEG